MYCVTCTLCLSVCNSNAPQILILLQVLLVVSVCVVFSVGMYELSS